jgi:hypothetical protein
VRDAPWWWGAHARRVEAHAQTNEGPPIRVACGARGAACGAAAVGTDARARGRAHALRLGAADRAHAGRRAVQGVFCNELVGCVCARLFVCLCICDCLALVFVFGVDQPRVMCLYGCFCPLECGLCVPMCMFLYMRACVCLLVCVCMCVRFCVPVVLCVRVSERVRAHVACVSCIARVGRGVPLCA